MNFEAGCKQRAQVALEFMNGYVAYSEAIMKTKTPIKVEAWLAGFARLSPGFIPAYKKLEAQGFELDAELGWGMDLILDAQDYPEQGFELLRCKGNDLLELRGRNWPEFKVVVKTLQRDGRYLIDGAGRVNIAESERAKR